MFYFSFRSDTWNEVVIVFLPTYEPFQLVLQGCVEDEGSYVAMDNIDLLQSFEGIYCRLKRDPLLLQIAI